MTPAGAAARTLGQTSVNEVRQALAGPGLWLDVGLATIRAHGDVRGLAEGVSSVYRHFPWCPSGAWADLHVQLLAVGGLRRFFRPQVRFWCDSQAPYQPFVASNALPLMEWGSNWQIGRRLNERVLLHAGVVERDGIALVMPALPGSGKSTLTAALALRGWRLLSDEFGALDPETLEFMPVLKPVGLKNQSIAVIRGFEPGVELGPTFLNTRKGDVAHLAPPAAAVARRHESALAGAVVMPRWTAGAKTHFEQLLPHMAFSSIAFNAFNYAVAGVKGFEAVAALARDCPVWQLSYSDLDDAIAQLGRMWPEVVARARDNQRQALSEEPGQMVPASP